MSVSAASTPPQGGAGAAVGAAAANANDANQVSAMPLPPANYIRHYSSEACNRGMTPPPPPPIHDHYTMFGHPFNPADDSIIQSLESQGIKRLYAAKDVDRKKELHKLNHSILVNFLDLLDHLIASPESTKREEKIEDLNLLFIHMHHLINEFRPHQARETLRVMLHVQKRRRLQVADKFKQHLDKVEETIEEALQALPDESENESKMTIDTEMTSSTGIELSMDASLRKDGMGATSAKDTQSQLDKLLCGLADDTMVTKK